MGESAVHLNASADWKRSASCTCAALVLHSTALTLTVPTATGTYFDVPRPSETTFWDVALFVEVSGGPPQPQASRSPHSSPERPRTPSQTGSSKKGASTPAAKRPQRGSNTAPSLSSPRSSSDSSHESSVSLASVHRAAIDIGSATRALPSDSAQGREGARTTANSGTPLSATAGAGGGEQSGPRLLVRGNPCAGFFPASTSERRGQVRITVQVGPTGDVISSRVRAVTPRESAFSQAAVACTSRLRFVPAKDHDGLPIQSQTTLTIDFIRD